MPSARVRSWLWLGIGGPAAVGGVALLTLAVPAAAADRAAYERAGRCTGDVTRGCWTELPATVVRTHVMRHKSDDFDVQVSVPGRPDLSRRVSVPTDTRVFYSLEPGDRVTLRVFRDRITHIDAPLGELVTEEAPDVDLATMVVLGTVLASWGGFGALVGLALRRRSRDDPDASGQDVSMAFGTAMMSADRSPLTVAFRVLFPAVLGSAVLFFVVVAFDVHDLSDALLWSGGATAVVAGAIAWHRLRTSGTGELEESG